MPSSEDKDDFINSLSLDLRHSFREADALLQSLHDFDDNNEQQQVEQVNEVEDDDEDSSVEEPVSTVSLHSDDDHDDDGEMADDMERLESSVESLRKDLDTTVLLVPRFIQKQNNRSQPLIALLDQSSDITMIHKRALPRGATPKLLRKPLEGRTSVGTFESRRLVWLEDIDLPQFSDTPRIDIQDAYVFDCKDCSCDIIAGRDFLLALAEGRNQQQTLDPNIPHIIEDD